MANPLQEGAEAPQFDLPADGGRRIRLGDFKGRPLVIYFYPKDDTSGCTKQAIGFSGLKSAFDRIGVEVVGISGDSAVSKESFKAKHGLSIALAADEDRAVAERYGVWVEKSMYGRKYMGIERSTFLIDGEGRIARVWRKVKVPGHAEEVLETAKKM